jgi:hypothetical protein
VGQVGQKKRLGSSVSTKQLAYAVKERRQITLQPAAGQPITGWLCGLDDYHYFVVDSDGAQYLVHKTGTVVQLHAETSTPPDQVCPVFEPFRESVLRNQFSQEPIAL